MGAYTAETNPLTHFDILVTEAVEYLEAHPEFQNQGTYMAEPVVYYMLSTLASPYDVRYDIHTLDSDYYVCGSLPEIQDGYNYIVRNHLNRICRGIAPQRLHRSDIYRIFLILPGS